MNYLLHKCKESDSCLLKKEKKVNKRLKNMNIEYIYFDKDYSIIDEKIETKADFLINSIAVLL